MRILARMLLLGTLAALAFPLFNIAEAGKDPSALARSSAPVPARYSWGKTWPRRTVSRSPSLPRPPILTPWSSSIRRAWRPTSRPSSKPIDPTRSFPSAPSPRAGWNWNSASVCGRRPSSPWVTGRRLASARAFFARAETVVVCPSRPRGPAPPGRLPRRHPQGPPLPRRTGVLRFPGRSPAAGERAIAAPAGRVGHTAREPRRQSPGPGQVPAGRRRRPSSPTSTRWPRPASSNGPGPGRSKRW